MIGLLGDLQIASDDGHDVRRDAVEEVLVPARGGDGRPTAVTIPLVTFLEDAR